MLFVDPPAQIIGDHKSSTTCSLGVVEQDCPYRMAAGLKTGYEVSVFSAILFHNVLHNCCNAIHVEGKVARILDPGPDGIRVMVGRNMPVARPSICHNHRRDQNEWSTLRGSGEEGGCFKEITLS